MSEKKFKIEWTSSAARALSAISDKRVQRGIFERANGLVEAPEKQGKALIGPLAGYRSIRAVGQRYRIVYRVERNLVVVYILAIGLRKDGDNHDIYALAKKLVKLGLSSK